MEQFINYSYLSFLPILSLLAISLWKGVKAGIYSGFIITTFLFFVSGSNILTFLASLISAFSGTLTILMIIFGAIFLYQVMDQKGYINDIKESLSGIHPDKNFRFFFLALFLTAFFESVAGFGTPGAIVPLLLITMGYSPVLSIAVVLLIDGFFAVSGAVGTPVIAGLEAPLNLNPDTLGSIYLSAGVSIFAAGLVTMFFIYKYLKKESGTKPGYSGWILFLAIIIPYVATSWFLKELTGIIAAATMAIFSYIFLLKKKKINMRPWLPYALLILLLILPKIIPPLGDLLAYKFRYQNILESNVSTSIQPFKSPMIPFLIATAFALWKVKDFNINVKPVFNKTLSVFLILFPSLAITELMMNSGNSSNIPSMVDSLAGVFVKAGVTYPLFAPIIGVIGTFITGSTTVSNVIFGPVQYNAAQALSLPVNSILGMQLAGASIGNSICLFNIIAAAAVAGVKKYNAILKKNLLPLIIASIGVALTGYIISYF